MVADLPAIIKVPANVSSIINVQFSDVENSGCECRFSATILMCNYPNVQVSSCAFSRMGKTPCAGKERLENRLKRLSRFIHAGKMASHPKS